MVIKLKDRVVIITQVEQRRKKKKKKKRLTNKMNPKKSIPRYVEIKMAKIKGKERILKIIKKKATHYIQGNSKRLSADF